MPAIDAAEADADAALIDAAATLTLQVSEPAPSPSEPAWSPADAVGLLEARVRALRVWHDVPSGSTGRVDACGGEGACVWVRVRWDHDGHTEIFACSEFQRLLEKVQP